MSILASPIYTGTLNGKPLRFFKSPLATPHLPWHSYDDLLCCIGVRKSIRDKTLINLRVHRPDDIRSIACGSNVLLIAPNYAARFFINHIPGRMKARQGHDIRYRAEMIDAWYASMSNSPSCDADSLLLLAIKNTDRADAGWAA